MNRTKKFALNSISSLTNQAILFAMGFIIPKIILLNYGNATNGLVTSVTQFISYFNILEAGLGGATIYALYKPLAEKDNKLISILVYTTEKLYRKVGLYFFLCVLILAFFYPLIVKELPINFNSTFFLIMFIGMNGVINFFSLGKYRTLLTADQKSYVVLNAISLNQILNMMIIIILTYFDVPITWVYGMAILPVGIRWWYLKSHTEKNYPEISNKYGIDNSLLKNRWDVLFQQIVGTAQTAFPTILATFMLGLVQVSVYSVYNIVVGGIILAVNMLPNSLSASFGDLIVRKETEKFQKTYLVFEYLFIIIIAIVFGVTLSMLLPFVKLYTNGIDNSVYLVSAISIGFTINGFINGIKTPYGMLIISAGHYRETRWRSLIQAVILVISSTILCYFYGVSGILIGAILANTYRLIDYIYYVPKKIIRISIWNSIKNIGFGLIIFAVAVIYYLKFGRFYYSIISWSEWLYKSFILFSILSGTALFITFLFNRVHLQYIMKKLKQFIKY